MPQKRVEKFVFTLARGPEIDQILWPDDLFILVKDIFLWSWLAGEFGIYVSANNVLEKKDVAEFGVVGERVEGEDVILKQSRIC